MQRDLQAMMVQRMRSGCWLRLIFRRREKREEKTVRPSCGIGDMGAVWGGALRRRRGMAWGLTCVGQGTHAAARREG